MWKYIAIFLLSIFIFSSCSYFKHIKIVKIEKTAKHEKRIEVVESGVKKVDEGNSETKVKAPKRKDKKKVLTAKAELKGKIKSFIDNGDYSQAIDLIVVAVKSGEPELSYGDHYINAINTITKKGLGYFFNNDCENAGVTLRKALINFPSSKTLTAKIDYSPEKLNSYIQTCTERLMEEGLLEYREGNLEKALSTWRKILKFNPDYSETKKAIDTATKQLKNLKAIE